MRFGSMVKWIVAVSVVAFVALQSEAHGRDKVRHRSKVACSTGVLIGSVGVTAEAPASKTITTSRVTVRRGQR